MQFEVYCDESRPDLFSTKSTSHNGRFLMIGSIWLPANQRDLIKQRIKSLKDRHKIGGQIKWQKISPSRIQFYKDLVDLFMGFGKDLRFRCICVDVERINFKLFHAGDKELGFYKFYYEMIHHWILDFNEYRIFCDVKTNRNPARLAILKNCLENSNLSSSISSIQSIPSGESALIQLADFLLGAAGATINNDLKTDSAKSKILNHLNLRLGINVLGPTVKGEEKFNVFKIRLEGGW